MVDNKYDVELVVAEGIELQMLGICCTNALIFVFFKLKNKNISKKFNLRKMPGGIGR